MSLRKLIKQDASTVLGIDSSTNSLAFCFFDGRPRTWGKILFTGGNIYDKVVDCRDKVPFIKEVCDPEYICIESAIMVKSQAVAINMAMVVGSIISVLAKDPQKIITITPIEWQTYIGNPNLKKYERDSIKTDNPGKTDNWYRNQSRNVRKQKTLDFFNRKYSMKLTDNDVGDACGLAYFAYERLTRHA